MRECGYLCLTIIGIIFYIVTENPNLKKKIMYYSKKEVFNYFFLIIHQKKGVFF